MTPLLKNIFVFGGCIVAVALGYFVITDSSSSLELNTSVAVREALIEKTQAFIDRSNKLKEVTIDVVFLSDPTFTSLRSFSTLTPDQKIGRDDLFSSVKNIEPDVSDNDGA